jgi:GNAT superfamily N-acetyltransferase
MNIRKATASDLPGLYLMIKGLFAEAKEPAKIKASAWILNWTKLIEMGMGVVLISEQDGKPTGAIAGFVHPDISDGVLTLSEAFWYVTPESRGHGIKLLKAFEDFAKSSGCERVMMIHLLEINAEALSKIYARRGYKAIEIHYVKDL